MVRLLLLVCSAIFLFSCSLTYTEEEPEVSHVPELVFSNAEYISYEDGKNSMVLQTSLLEQYRNDKTFYANRVFFFTYTEEGELSSQGSCEIISVDPDKKEYVLLGNVVVDSIEEDIVFKAHSMQWNGESEQLVTSATDSINLIRGKRKWDKTWNEVTKEKEGSSTEESEGSQEDGSETWIEMTGIGFSSSATSMTFDFTGEVSGFIYSRKKQEEQQ